MQKGVLAMAFAQFSALILVHSAGWDQSGGWNGGWWIWSPVMFLFWIAAVALIVWFVRRSSRHDSSGIDRARGILAERYARDELSADEYRERLDNLK
jgi:putative membrane protein